MPVSYDAGAECHQFESFLEWMIPDAEQRLYVQTYIGLCLTGLNIRAFLTFVGDGANGKSTLLNVLHGMFGPARQGSIISNAYHIATKMNTLTGADEDPGGARADLMLLDAKRLISASEANKSGDKPVRLNLALLKSWTGDDPGTHERGLYEATMKELRRHGKFFIFTNNMPEIGEDTNAAWERIKIVRCVNTKKPEEQIARFHERLLTEKSGILNWALRGLARYFAEGQKIPTPKSMLNDVEAFRKEDDPIRAFLDAGWEERLHEEGKRKGEKQETAANRVYEAFEEWFQENISIKREPPKKRAFTKAVEAIHGKARRGEAAMMLPIVPKDPGEAPGVPA
jgi:putative DNA primase/helicase